MTDHEMLLCTLLSDADGNVEGQLTTLEVMAALNNVRDEHWRSSTALSSAKK